MGRLGNMKDTAIGLLLYGVPNNGLDQLDMNIYLKPFARGAFLLAAIALNIAALRIASRAQTRGDIGNIHDETNAMINEPIPHTTAPMSEPHTNEMESR